jgi:hypothetical protein
VSGGAESFFIRSTDNGEKWSIPRVLTSGDSFPPFGGHPKLAVSNNRLYLLTTSLYEDSGIYNDRGWFVRSNDYGQSWEDGRTLLDGTPWSMATGDVPSLVEIGS